MKATSMILTAVLTLQIGVLFAGNDAVIPVNEVNSTASLVSIAPTTPVEATFEDVVLMDQFAGLSPMTPDEASFEEFSLEMISISDLSQVTPVEAGFDDVVEVAVNQLAPVTPLEADFE